ncbi:hypothetical protein M3Y97_00438700 [Aphelenchoides bicaudatus]|nr:hypothetical protein M3Y97_00438700 [Aphelenchoides bicaudatus]
MSARKNTFVRQESSSDKKLNVKKLSVAQPIAQPNVRNAQTKVPSSSSSSSSSTEGGLVVVNGKAKVSSQSSNNFDKSSSSSSEDEFDLKTQPRVSCTVKPKNDKLPAFNKACVKQKIVASRPVMNAPNPANHRESIAGALPKIVVKTSPQGELDRATAIDHLKEIVESNSSIELSELRKKFEKLTGGRIGARKVEEIFGFRPKNFCHLINSFDFFKLTKHEGNVLVELDDDYFPTGDLTTDEEVATGGLTTDEEDV